MEFRVLLLLLLLPGTQGKIVFSPLRHEPRIYTNAPVNVLVTKVHAEDVTNPSVEISYSVHQVQDHELFRVDRTSGHVYTRRVINRHAGKLLNIMVVAYGQGEAVLEHLRVRVTEFNAYAPMFDFDIYRTEISYLLPVNTTILRIRAKDNDTLPYNSEIYYSVDSSSNDSNHFSINSRTGDVRLRKKLEKQSKKILIEVKADDGGSPMRSSKATIDIAVKTITEPQNINNDAPAGSSVNICWEPPAAGRVVGYLIRYRSVADGVHTVNITAENSTAEGSTGHCYTLHSLRPWTDYEYRLYAWNENENGLGSDVNTFGTRSNHCLSHPCHHGRCFPLNEDPGYYCDCDHGYYGNTCSHFNSCVLKPCGEFGICRNISHHQYLCECLPGFSGMNCTHFDPCAIRPSPCVHGATCINNMSNAYYCQCRPGFYGRTCEHYDPCHSSPCHNEATCQSVPDDEYKCVCQPGYQGKHCDVDIDECISSPCLNKGTCIDQVNGFYCKCPPGYSGDSCEHIGHCNDEVTGEFHWPSSSFGTTLYVTCPYGGSHASRECIVDADDKVRWSSVDDSRCKQKGFVAAEALTEKLGQMTATPSNMTAAMFAEATEQLENILSFAVYDQKIAQGMLSVVSNMMDIDEAVLKNDSDSSLLTNRLVDVVKKFSASVVIKETESTVRFDTENLSLQTTKWNASMPTEELTFQKSFSRKKRETDMEMKNETQKETSIVIPQEALQMAMMQMDEIRVQFISFSNSKFFRESNSTNSTFQVDISQSVLIASILNASIENLTTPVTYVMTAPMSPVCFCAYWKELENEWSTDGLQTNQTDNLIYCSSNHMTAFSVLFDPDPNSQLSEEHKKALSIISYIGCALSVVGLTLTVATYCLFRCLNRDRSGKILLNLCFSMLLLNISFLLGSQQNEESHEDLCVGVAVLLHYFLLTTLAWMCVEAINMYQMLIHVFASAETHFMLKRCLAAWGIPLIMVVATVGVDIGFYYNKNEYCMLSPHNPYAYYISFLGPSCIILLINSIVFIMVTRVLFQPRPASAGKSQQMSNITFAQVRGAFTVMTLLGITWVFGALAIGPTKLLFQYLFCIFNSLQGFLLFLVRCVHYPEARSAWIQLLKSGTLKKYRGGALVSTSHSQSNGGRSTRTGSADISSSTTDKDRKESVTSLKISLLSRSSNSSGSSHPPHKPPRRSSAPVRKISFKELQMGSPLKQTPPSPSLNKLYGKEGRDTHWQYYGCALQSLNQMQQVKSHPHLSSVNTDDLPFIEDEIGEETPSSCSKAQSMVLPAAVTAGTPQPENTSQSDQGYSSAENSPNSKRLLSMRLSPVESKPEEELPEELPNDSELCVTNQTKLEPIISATNSLAEELNAKDDMELIDWRRRRKKYSHPHCKSLEELQQLNSPSNSVLPCVLHSTPIPLNSSNSLAFPLSQIESTDSICTVDNQAPKPSRLISLKEKYGDAFVVSSLEDIDYMDASSVEGENAIVCVV